MSAEITCGWSAFTVELRGNELGNVEKLESDLARTLEISRDLASFMRVLCRFLKGT